MSYICDIYVLWWVKNVTANGKRTCVLWEVKKRDGKRQTDMRVVGGEKT